MKKILAVALILSLFNSVRAASVSPAMPLWPNGAPGEPAGAVIGPEHDITKDSDRKVEGKWVIRLTGVSTPTITVYSPSRRKANGTAVLICPGGAYHILALDLEGIEIAKWLNSLGVTAVVLKYRVPGRTNDVNHILPLQDAQRALGLVRFHAVEWNIDPRRIGIMGFSAGGHLTAHLCNDFQKREYKRVDNADKTSCRPDFALMIYPAYLVTKTNLTLLAPEFRVTKNTPPTFLVQTEDDGVHVENSIEYYLALKRAKVPAELHDYATGGHGYGLRPSKDPVSTWPQRAEAWLRGRGLLEKPKSK